MDLFFAYIFLVFTKDSNMMSREICECAFLFAYHFSHSFLVFPTHFSFLYYTGSKVPLYAESSWYSMLSLVGSL
jgi:hypothetical protein